jgi:lipoprotein-releasing system permease protein
MAGRSARRGVFSWPTRLERQIALRYLRGRRRSYAPSLNTVIAVGGIAVGVAALLVVLGVMNGLRDDLRDRILVGNPHLRILVHGTSLRMDDWQVALRVIREDSEVVAAAPEVITKSMVYRDPDYPAVVDLLGFDPDTGSVAVTSLAQHLTSGDLTFRTTRDDVEGGVILGYRLAQRLSAFPGDVVTFLSATSARPSRVTGTITPRYLPYEVVGTFDTGMYQYDDGFAVMSLEQAQSFTSLGDAVTGIIVRVQDPWRAPEVGERLVEELGYPFRSLDWQAQNEGLFSALKLEKLAMGVIILFIMIVAAFNIIGTLTMVVADRTREIGILQAMGLDRSAISRIFLAQGTIMGLIGTSIGVALGLGLGWLIDWSGLIRIDPAIYFIDRLPVRMEALDLLVVIVVALGVAVLATIHPSRSAAALTPVDAIRHE